MHFLPFFTVHVSSCSGGVVVGDNLSGFGFDDPFLEDEGRLLELFLSKHSSEQ